MRRMRSYLRTAAMIVTAVAISAGLAAIARANKQGVIERGGRAMKAWQDKGWQCKDLPHARSLDEKDSYQHDQSLVGPKSGTSAQSRGYVVVGVTDTIETLKVQVIGETGQPIGRALSTDFGPAVRIDVSVSQTATVRVEAASGHGYAADVVCCEKNE